MDEILTKVGRIGFVSKGEYNQDTQYDKQDIIQYQNTTYAVLQPVQGVTPTDDKVNYTKWVDGTAYVPIATTEAAGVVKPDGDTITVDEDGTMHSHIEVDDAMSETSENPVQNKVVKEYVDDIGKNTRTNLLNCTMQTEIKNGVTCTNNGDGTYTLNGTASAQCQFVLNRVLLDNKTYKLCGCPQGGGGYIFHLRARKPNGEFIDYDEGEGAIIKIGEVVEFLILIQSSITCNNLIFKPMLTTDLSATYDSFVPYTGDTSTLNGDVAQVRGAIGDAWNSTDTYAVDDLRIDENGLYKCLIPNTGQKPSTSPTYWEKTSVEEEFKKITTTNTVTAQVNSQYITKLSIKERNGIVFVSGTIAKGWSGSNTLFTIPAPYRPIANCFAQATIAASSSDINKILSVTIVTGGTCSAWLKEALLEPEPFSLCYICTK